VAKWRFPDEPADLYGVLGVGADASRQDIVRAYRRQVHAWHPDARPDDPGAAARFRAATAAYDVLADQDRRARYDRVHQPGAPSRPPRRQDPAASAARSRRVAPAAEWPWSMSTRADADVPGRPDLGVPLWAGPVQVRPAQESPAAAVSGLDPDEVAALTAWLARHLAGGWGWRR
jgi:curved DNA-binding protein CbpA